MNPGRLLPKGGGHSIGNGRLGLGCRPLGATCGWACVQKTVLARREGAHYAATEVRFARHLARLGRYVLDSGPIGQLDHSTDYEKGRGCDGTDSTSAETNQG